MSAILNLPDIRPSLQLDFANSVRVDPRIQFTRAGTATCYGSDGKLRTVAANVPRIDYDPVTGKCRGLLVEGQSTNLLRYSEQFDNAVWSNTNVSVTTNAITAPDGTLTADKLIATSVSSSHFTAQTLSFTSGKTYTVSVFAKAGEYTWTRLHFGGGAVFPIDARAASFNLANGTLGAAAPGVISRISDAGNGWYRCSITVTAIGTGADVCGFNVQNADSVYSTTFLGNDSDGIYTWGAQVEEGQFSTSYIPTTASQVTRASDAASMTGTNFTSWYRQDEGTFVVDYSLDVIYSGFPSAWAVSGTDGDAINHVVNSGSRNIRYEYRKAGSLEKDIPVSNTSASVKTAFCYGQGTISQSTLGAAVTNNSPVSVIAVEQFNIGQRSNTGHLNGHIRRIAYYPRRITNEQLQRLTVL